MVMALSLSQTFEHLTFKTHTHSWCLFALLDWNAANKVGAQQVQTEDKWLYQTVKPG